MFASACRKGRLSMLWMGEMVPGGRGPRRLIPAPSNLVGVRAEWHIDHQTATPGEA